MPTKNRSDLVRNSIESILAQSFKNFEIIIADNDDSKNTFRNIKTLLKDKRIHYIKTSNLSMVENWEFARNAATGEYLTVLEDKQMFYPHALNTISNALCHFENIEILGWLPDRFSSHSPVLRRSKFANSSYEIIDPKTIIFDSINNSFTDSIKLPRLINSVVSSKLINRVIKKSNINQFFHTISPDFTACFLTLGEARSKYILLNMPLVITDVSKKRSNGQKNLSSINHTLKFLNESRIKKERVYKKMPIKYPFVINAIYSDYYFIRSINKTLPLPKINLDKYLKMISFELSLKHDINFHELLKVIKNINIFSHRWALFSFLLFFLKYFISKIYNNKQVNKQYSMNEVYKKYIKEDNLIYLNIEDK